MAGLIHHRAGANHVTNSARRARCCERRLRILFTRLANLWMSKWLATFEYVNEDNNRKSILLKVDDSA